MPFGWLEIFWIINIGFPKMKRLLSIIWIEYWRNPTRVRDIACGSTNSWRKKDMAIHFSQSIPLTRERLNQSKRSFAATRWISETMFAPTIRSLKVSVEMTLHFSPVAPPSLTWPYWISVRLNYVWIMHVVVRFPAMIMYGAVQQVVFQLLRISFRIWICCIYSEREWKTISTASLPSNVPKWLVFVPSTFPTRR